jgi:hypothetical protein
MKTTILIGLLSLALFCIPSTYGQMNEWTRQFGTSNNDISFGVSADGLGNVYISGETDGNLEGTRAGSFDAFITKYNANGTLQWTQQFGTSEWDIATGVYQPMVWAMFTFQATPLVPWRGPTLCTYAERHHLHFLSLKPPLGKLCVNQIY